VVAELQKRGIAAPNTTRLRGDVVIRCCLMNHRATRDDMDLVVDGVLRTVAKMRRRGPGNPGPRHREPFGAFPPRPVQP
jgi:hypothetical protein